jgi:hypothetical protein
MPCEHDLRHGLGVDILFHEPLKQGVAHGASALLVVEKLLFEIVAVFAMEVARGAGGLHHYI